jgi:hypothetical protein
VKARAVWHGGVYCSSLRDLVEVGQAQEKRPDKLRGQTSLRPASPSLPVSERSLHVKSASPKQRDRRAPH